MELPRYGQPTKPKILFRPKLDKEDYFEVRVTGNGKVYHIAAKNHRWLVTVRNTICNTRYPEPFDIVIEKLPSLWGYAICWVTQC